MKPNKEIKEFHIIPRMQFATVDLMVRKDHLFKLKAMVLAKGKYLKQ
jgi:hypothetical protein